MNNLKPFMGGLFMGIAGVLLAVLMIGQSPPPDVGLQSYRVEIGENPENAAHVWGKLDAKGNVRWDREDQSFDPEPERFRAVKADGWVTVRINGEPVNVRGDRLSLDRVAWRLEDQSIAWTAETPARGDPAPRVEIPPTAEIEPLGTVHRPPRDGVIAAKLDSRATVRTNDPETGKTVRALMGARADPEAEAPCEPDRQRSPIKVPEIPSSGLGWILGNRWLVIVGIIAAGGAVVVAAVIGGLVVLSWGARE